MKTHLAHQIAKDAAPRLGADAPTLPDRATTTVRFRQGGAGDRMADRDVPVEAPVAIEVDGLSVAVLMATPVDLTDFGLGFVRAEGLIGGVEDVRDVEVVRVPAGHVVRLRLRGDARRQVFARQRTRAVESACGLCGVANLEAALPPLPRLTRPLDVAPDALDRAYRALPDHQHHGRRTSAMHAAALCDPDGRIQLVREDVGRHSALDKLVGAALAEGIDTASRFALVTSRLSFELVEKAVRAPLGALAAISAPTSLALDRARDAGLPVYVLVRGETFLTPEPPAR